MSLKRLEKKKVVDPSYSVNYLPFCEDRSSSSWDNWSPIKK